jgi:hypothetical protein
VYNSLNCHNELDEIGRTCSRHRERKNTYRVLVGKPEGKKPVGRPRWEDDIEMDLRKITLSGLDWIDLAQDKNSGGLL